jgi:hypothetical protein
MRLTVLQVARLLLACLNRTTGARTHHNITGGRANRKEPNNTLVGSNYRGTKELLRRGCANQASD